MCFYTTKAKYGMEMSVLSNASDDDKARDKGEIELEIALNRKTLKKKHLNLSFVKHKWVFYDSCRNYKYVS